MAKPAKNYQLHVTNRLLRDAASVRFHAANDDYFGTAATVIHLIRQRLTADLKTAPGDEGALIEKALKNLEQDLLILQSDYQIKANKKNSQAADKGKLKSQ